MDKQMDDRIPVSKEMHGILTGIWHDRLSPRGIIFTYLCAKAFSIVRYPSTPDRSVDDNNLPLSDVTDLINSYGDDKISELVEEVRYIKDRTKSILLRNNVGSDHIILQRALSPLTECQYRTAVRKCDEPTLFPMLAMAAKRAGLETFKIDVDIVSGWSTSSINRYGSLHISRKWHVNDIIVVSDYLVAPEGGVGALESNEWLCLNRNENGLIEFNVSDCTFDCIPEKLRKYLHEHPAIEKLATELQDKAEHQSSQRKLSYRPMNSLNAPKVRLSLSEKFKILFCQ